MARYKFILLFFKIILMSSSKGHTPASVSRQQSRQQGMLWIVCGCCSVLADAWCQPSPRRLLGHYSPWNNRADTQICNPQVTHTSDLELRVDTSPLLPHPTHLDSPASMPGRYYAVEKVFLPRMLAVLQTKHRHQANSPQSPHPPTPPAQATVP